MRRPLRACLGLALLLLISTQSCSRLVFQSGPTVHPPSEAATTLRAANLNPHIFTIMGLMLGMRADEVSVTLRRRGLSPKIRHTPCVSDYLNAARAHLAPQTNCIKLIEVDEPTQDVLLTFVENYPQHPNESVLLTISVNLRAPLALSSKAMLSDLEARLGPPMVTDGHTPIALALWCSADPCSFDASDHIDSGPHILYDSSGGETYIDPRSYFRHQNAIRNYLASHGLVERQD